MRLQDLSDLPPVPEPPFLYEVWSWCSMDSPTVVHQLSGREGDTDALPSNWARLVLEAPRLWRACPLTSLGAVFRPTFVRRSTGMDGGVSDQHVCVQVVSSVSAGHVDSDTGRPQFEPEGFFFLTHRGCPRHDPTSTRSPQWKLRSLLWGVHDRNLHLTQLTESDLDPDPHLTLAQTLTQQPSITVTLALKLM